MESISKFTEERVSLKTVMLMRMMVGFYCNISCNRIISFLARLYCICLAIIVNTMVYLGCIKYKLNISFFAPLCLEYNLNVLVSLCTGESHLINFYNEIERTDREMGFEDQPLMTFRCKCLFLFIFAYKTVFHVQLFFVFQDKSLTLMPTILMAYAISIGGVSRCFPIEILRLRIKHLWCVLETNLKLENWRQNSHKINSVVESLKLYKHFMNNLMIMSWEKFLICVSLTSTFFFVLLNCRDLITGLKGGNYREVFRNVHAFDLVLICGLTCMPAILSEMIAKEVEELRLVIGNALLFCDDDDLHTALEEAIEYLILSPYSATVCRAFALDATLVLSFFSMCTTYAIFIIQYMDIV